MLELEKTVTPGWDVCTGSNRDASMHEPLSRRNSGVALSRDPATIAVDYQR
jgi:hypothetical protein